MHTLDRIESRMDTPSLDLDEVGGFEGPEKRLEVDFKSNPERPLGLRAHSKDQWQELLNLAKCTIISHTASEYCDAYVLSESSLFVFPFKVMLKTCGTTTLLKTLPKLLEYATNLDLSVELVMYSRKKLLYPDQQQYPHIHWNDEIDYLNKMFDGTAYVLGPLTQEHWYLYLADYSDHERVLQNPEVTMEIMMHRLDRSAAAKFYKDELENPSSMDTAEEAIPTPTISELIPGSTIDEFQFEPCGYSMNGLNKDVYWTIHVTPEPQCSYASFETNISLSCYKKLVSKVLKIFRPGTFTLTLFCENSPEVTRAFDVNIQGYVLKHKTFSELEGYSDITLCNYEAIDSQQATPQKKEPRVPPDLAPD